MPLDRDEEFVIELGNERYVLNPRDEMGNSRIDFYRDNQLIHGYTAKPMLRDISHFADVIQDSFTDQSTFMRGLIYIRFYRNRLVAVRNFALIEFEGSDMKIRQLSGREELMGTMEEKFSIPREIISDAINEIIKVNPDWEKP